MKGSIDIPITIIATVLVILTLVIGTSSLQNFFVSTTCNQPFKENIDRMINRACEMTDADIDELGFTIDLKDCISELRFDNNNNNLIYKMKGKQDEFELDTKCFSGHTVIFDFSIINDGILKSDIKKKYPVLIRPNNIKVIFCKGDAQPCDTFNENECNQQKGCQYSENRCTGTTVSCYSLNENECKARQGCEVLNE